VLPTQDDEDEFEGDEGIEEDAVEGADDVWGDAEAWEEESKQGEEDEEENNKHLHDLLDVNVSLLKVRRYARLKNVL
jgi:hypothetical protein